MPKPTLRDSAALIFRVLQVLPAGATLTRQSDGVILEVNVGYEGMLGYTRAEVIGRRISDLNLLYTLSLTRNEPARARAHERGPGVPDWRRAAVDTHKSHQH